MEEKRNKILEVARRLFWQYGLRSVTMDEIAVETGMSKKTIYQVFKSKKSLVEEIVHYGIERLRQKIYDVIENEELNPIERTIEIHKIIMQMYGSYPPQLERDLQRLYPDVVQEIQMLMMEQMSDAIINNLIDGIEKGFYRDDLNPEIIAGFQHIHSQFLRFRDQYSFLSGYSDSQVLNELLKYHLYGICSARGLEFLKTINFDSL